MITPAQSTHGDITTMLANMRGVYAEITGYMKRRARALQTPMGLPTLGALYTHDNTVGNLVQTIYERIKGRVVEGEWEPTLQPQAGAFLAASLRRFRDRLCRRLPRYALRVSRDAFLDHYTGQKRRRYEAAVLSLGKKRLQRADAYPGVFLKAEKWKEKKAGRAISARSPRYNVELGRYLLPLEKRVYQAIGEVFGAPTIMKGFTPEGRARVLADHWREFDAPVAVGQDFSKFDQHISRQALEYEHGVYLSMYGNDNELQRLLGWQLHNRCYADARDGKVKYTTDGGRMSGDMNTAMGNCIISAALLWAYADEKGIRIKAIVDGDDSVAIMETADLQRYLQGIEGWMQDKGFRLVTEEPVYQLCDVEFCQCKYVESEPPTMVRNPVKAITQDHAWVLDRSITHQEVLAATGLGGLSLYGNMPVLGAYYAMLARTTELSTKTLSKLNFQSSWLRDAAMAGGVRVEPSEATRLAFYKSWNISPGEQRALEAEFDALSLVPSFAADSTRIHNPSLKEYRSFYTICTTT